MAHIISSTVVNLVLYYIYARNFFWESNEISRSFSVVWSCNKFLQ